MPLFYSFQKEINEKKYGTRDGNQCICCSKPIKEGEVLMIHLNVNLEAVHPNIPEDKCKELTGFESQGWFPIGNSCAKKMKGFVF